MASGHASSNVRCTYTMYQHATLNGRHTIWLAIDFSPLGTITAYIYMVVAVPVQWQRKLSAYSSDSGRLIFWLDGANWQQ